MVLSAAVLVLYVVRARGGVWGGVRVYMAWAPLLLVFSVPLLLRSRWRILGWLLAAAVAAGFLAMDLRQIRFFNRYKRTDLEDQRRNEEDGRARDRIADNAVERPAPDGRSTSRMRFALVAETGLAEGIHVAHRHHPSSGSPARDIDASRTSAGQPCPPETIIENVYKNDRIYFSLFRHNHERAFSAV